MAPDGSAGGGSTPVSVSSIDQHPKVEGKSLEGGKNQGKRSWTTVVQNNLGMIKYDVSAQSSEGGLVAVPEVVLGDSPLWEDFLVGRFMATAPHIAKIHMIVNKIWTLGDKSIKIDVYEVDAETVRFRVRDSTTRSRVLRRGMWNICDIPMIVSRWSPVEDEMQPEIKTMPLWVTLEKVPLSMFSWKGLSFIASKVGHPKRLHPDTELCRRFEDAKIFVEADLTKDFPLSHKFTLKGKEVEVKFSYPWLPTRCTNCERWGHATERCSENTTFPQRNESAATPTQQAQTQMPSVAVQEQQSTAPDVNNGTIVVQSISEEEKEEGEIQEPSENMNEWNSVSPKKTGKHIENARTQDTETKIVSPSRFSVLAKTEEDETDQTEEKEKSVAGNKMEDVINADTKTEVSSLKFDGVGIRLPLPRASKPKPGSVAQLIKKKNLGGKSTKAPSQ